MALRPAASAFLTWLFSRSTEPLSGYQVVAWWEIRRLAYNLIVGTFGAAGVVIMVVVALICERRIGIPIGMSDPPVLMIVAAVAYGIFANLCYTGGWIAELLARPRLGSERARAFGEASFKIGIGFSVVLTLLPPACTIVAAALALLNHP